MDRAEIDELVKMVGKLEDTAYVTTARYDAQGRVVQTRLPMSGSTHRTSYTEDGLLERIDRETAGGTHERVYETEDFDHLGRPRSVRHGEHAARTSFTYDPVTERLLRLQSQGGGRSLQDLHYSYDPVGNLTQVRDAAQAIVYRDNAALEAVNDYRYDALYRLVEATGREHEGQAANGRTPKSSDAVVVPLRASSPSDPKAMRRYVQRYRYDAVGNLRTLQHQAGAGSFRREYAYAEHGNRLRATGNAALALHERYAYDVAGHMVAMPHLSRLHWDETDALEFVQRGTQQIWLQYAGGVRVRKVVRSGEGVVEDRKYLGSEEIYTKRRGGALVERTLTEHVGGALQVDIKLVAGGTTIAKPVALRRYALGDHLGSVKLEVDPDGQVIAYEEFHPYGTTSYRAMHSGLDAAANRYRYTGMEKDEETGLAQHGARYYAAWLGRWTSPDPTGLADGVNRYAYCRGSPTSFIDRDGCSTAAPDDDMMAAPRSVRRKPWPRGRRVGPAQPEPWELEFYDPDPMGTRFMDGMRGTHAAQLGSFGRLADLAVGGVSDAANVGRVLYGVAMTIAVGPKARHLHFGLDVLGVVPGPVGMAADVLNALIYSAQGDDANAALSTVSAIGGLYDAAKAAKYADDLVEGAVLMLTGGGAKVSTRAARPGATPDARVGSEAAEVEAAAARAGATSTHRVRPSDLYGGKHASDRPLADVVSEAGKRIHRPGHPMHGRTLPQGRWTSPEAAQAAADRADPALGRQVVELAPGEGVVIHGNVRSYPPDSSKPNYLQVDADRALAIPQEDGTIHIFPIDSTHYLYGAPGARP